MVFTMASVPNLRNNLKPIASTHEMEEMALGLCIALNINLIIWGNPGAGKTEVIKTIARSYGMNLTTTLVSSMEPEDVSGSPYVDISTGKMKHSMPLYVEDVMGAWENPEGRKPSIVFWDEFSTGKPDVQAAALTTILDRKAGRFQMPPQTRMIAAANPPKVAANGWDLSAPTANRFTHIDWKLDAATIAAGFQQGWKAPAIPALPQDANLMKRTIKNAKILVGAFIRRNPASVEFDFASFRGNANADNFRASENAFPTARSWEVAAKIYGGASLAKLRDGSPIPNAVVHMLLEGTVGVAQASEFMNYVKELDLPDPVEALQNPDGFELPNRNDLLSALLASVEAQARAAMNHSKYQVLWNNWGNVITRVVDEGNGDIALPFAKVWQASMPEGAGYTDRHAKSLQGLIHAFGRV